LGEVVAREDFGAGEAGEAVSQFVQIASTPPAEVLSFEEEFLKFAASGRVGWVG